MLQTAQPILHLVKADPGPAVDSPRTLNELELSLREYLITKKQEGKSPGTLEKYEWQLRRWLAWLAERGVSQPGQLSRLLVREWGASLYEARIKSEDETEPKAWSPATIKHTIAVVRGFLNWCASEGRIQEPLSQALKPPKDKKRMQRTLSAEEVACLVAACPDTPEGRRDAAVVSLMVDSGLRASEVCRLKAADLVFDFPFGEERLNFLAVVGKGGDEEVVCFGQETADLLRKWLAVRPAKPGVEALFVGLRGTTPGRRMTRYGLGSLLRRRGRQAGVKGVSPHSLRRTFALLLDEAGASTRLIQALGRWSDIKMVERYTQALKAARHYNRFSPMDYVKRQQTPKSGISGSVGNDFT